MARKITKTTKSKPANTAPKKLITKLKTKDELKFEIDQLRKDKMIYALEAISTSVAALIFIIGISLYLPRNQTQLARPLYNFGFGVGIGYWFFTVVGNTIRLFKIKKLEKELKLRK